MQKILMTIVLAGVAGWLWAEVTPVSPDQEKQWVNWLVPRPHEVAISNAVTVKPGEVAVRLCPDAGAVEKQAASELKDLFQARAGVVPAGAAFEIVVGVLDAQGQVDKVSVAGADRLKTLPNKDQAYLIQPEGDHRLVIAGLSGKGVYYGVQTLKQLLESKITKEQATIPLAVVTDWPDMAERGVWNIRPATPGLIPWMTAVKLNFNIIPLGIMFKTNEPAQCPPLPMDLIRQAEQRAFHLVPHLTHYDYWWQTGFSNLYPELVGKGASAMNPQAALYPNNPKHFENSRCPCASNPKFTALVTDWVRSAADQGAREVSLWLTEFAPCQCACAACLKDGPRQFQLETRASLDALQTVQKTYPDLVGRIFFTLGGVPGDYLAKNTRDSAECLAMLPPGFKAEKVYGSNKAFDDYAAKGNWLANYSGPAICVPSSLMRFAYATGMQASVNAYKDAHYSGLYCIGSGGHDNKFADYQLQALAEWTWNSKGRDRRAFATAWATRQGLSHPDQFGAWIDLMEPVELKFIALHDAGADIWAKALSALAARQPLPANFPTPEVLTNCLAECDKAVSMAAATGDQSVMVETMLLQTFFQSCSQLVAMHKLVMQTAADKPVDRAGVEQAVKSIRDSLEASVGHLKKQQAILWVDLKNMPSSVLANYQRYVTNVVEELTAFPAALTKEQK